MDGIWCAELDACIEWLLALCKISERGSHLLWFPSTGGRFRLSERHNVVQNDHRDFEHDKFECPAFLSIVTGSENSFLRAC